MEGRDRGGQCFQKHSQPTDRLPRLPQPPRPPQTRTPLTPPDIHVLKHTSKIRETRHDVSLSAAVGEGGAEGGGGWEVSGEGPCALAALAARQGCRCSACRIATSGSRPRLYRDCSSVYSRNCQSEAHSTPPPLHPTLPPLP